MPTKTFMIHRADGSLPETLINSFLIKRDLSLLDKNKGTITYHDGTVWKLVIEDIELDIELELRGYAYAIISLQAHTDGNYAVSRLFDKNRVNKPRGIIGKLFKEKTKEKSKEHRKI